MHWQFSGAHSILGILGGMVPQLGLGIMVWMASWLQFRIEYLIIGMVHGTGTEIKKHVYN